MAKVLVGYATTEGQTRKVARAIGDHLAKRRDDVRVVDLADRPYDFDPAGYDAFILAGSIHIMRYQAAVADFVNHNLALLNERPSAFISVSLSALAHEPEDEENAREVARKFFEAVEWTPRAVHHAAGALRFTQYDFFKKWVLKRIAKEHGYDVTGRTDIEFTDWRALEAFADEFMRDHVAGG